MSAPVYSVWLGSRASIWSHRGYAVLGECVYTSSKDDAVRLVRESLHSTRCPALAWVEAGESLYAYTTRARADADETGADADAVVTRQAEGGAQ